MYLLIIASSCYGTYHVAMEGTQLYSSLKNNFSIFDLNYFNKEYIENTFRTSNLKITF